jgi:predicted transcriptional regulator
MKNRSNADIAAAMLRVVENGGARKTPMFFGAAINERTGKIYLNELKRTGLVWYDEIEELYYATEQGKSYLNIFREMSKMLPIKRMLKFGN